MPTGKRERFGILPGRTASCPARIVPAMENWFMWSYPDHDILNHEGRLCFLAAHRDGSERAQRRFV
jgi:hypothetical protein